MVNEQTNILLRYNAFFVGIKRTILVSRLINTVMAVIPSNSGKLMTKSVVICCHFRFGRGIGCNNLPFSCGLTL